MAMLYLVRHGKAAAGWSEDPDPGLDDTGRAQAEARAQDLAKRFADRKPLQVVTSPLKRCRETAAALCGLWGVEPTVVPAVAEIPSPTEDLQARTDWLRAAMAGRWSDLEAPYQAWRMNVVRALADLPQDTVVFSHFIAINVAVGQAVGSDKVVEFRPDNCSLTIMQTVADELRLVEKGAEAETVVR